MKKIQKFILLKITPIFFLAGFFAYKTYPSVTSLFKSKGSITPISKYTFAIDKKIIVDVDNLKIVVPSGFKTDLATIPRLLWPILPPQYTKFIYPSIVHDFLYETNLLKSRKMADKIFYDLLISNNVSLPVAYIMWVSVRLFGGVHYNDGKKKITRNY